MTRGREYPGGVVDSHRLVQRGVHDEERRAQLAQVGLEATAAQVVEELFAYPETPLAGTSRRAASSSPLAPGSDTVWGLIGR